MLVKKRKRPIPLQKLEAILSRIVPNHQAINAMRKDLEKYKKGFQGERKSDYFLRSAPDEFAVLHDVTLNILSKQIQMDSILVTENALFLLEVKNFSGMLTFDTIYRQLIAQTGEKLHGYDNPLAQVENIDYHLRIWLRKRGITGLPIYSFIVFSDRSTIYRVTGDNEMNAEICYADEVLFRLIELNDNISQDRSQQTSLKNRFIKTILPACIDFDFDVMKKFGVVEADLLPGVHCPNCGTLGMTRVFRIWHCSKCNLKSNDAHLSSLAHYALLVDQEIKNEPCRRFLQLNTRHEAHTILKNAECTLKTGTRIWQINHKWLQKQRIESR